MAAIPRIFQPPKGHFFLFGPRGTGKSTWIQHAFPGALRVDLLAPETLRAYLARPERLRELLQAHPDQKVVVIDEVQRVPELLDVVHEQIEAQKGRRRFVLTGSSARKLRRAGVNLLAGRAIRTALHPFIAAELGAAFELERALTVGLVPLVWDAAEAERTLQGYLSLYVREEVQAEGLVRDLGGFARFIEAISFSHASPLNLTKVARECDVSRKTTEGYLSILYDLLLGFEVPIFSRRAKRLLQAHPKFFWFDTGVFRSARPAGPLDRPTEIEGPALEGLVAQHLRAWIDYSTNDCTLSYWRTKSGNEVDFVVYGRAGFWAIEVKNARRIQPADLRGLRAFHEDHPTARLGLIYRGRERLVVDGIPCIPAADFLAGILPARPLPL